MQGCQFFQYIGPSCIGACFAFFATLIPELVKHDFAKLLWGPHVKGFARQIVNFGLKPCHFLRKCIRHARQRITVNLDACAFHRRQHGNQGAFKAFVYGGDFVQMQLRFEQFPQAQSDVRIFGSIFRGLVNSDVVECDRGFPRPQKRFDRNGFVIQIALRQRIHTVTVQTAMQGIRHQHRVINRRNGDPQIGKDLGIIFHVLPDFQDRRILKNGFEHVQGSVQPKLSL